MTILETFLSITPMLYVSIVLLPAALYGYLVVSKPKRHTSILMANPGDQLKEKTVDVRKEIVSALFLGSMIALGAAIIVFVGGIVADFKSSNGIFAVIMPAATTPPSLDNVFPPAPVETAPATAPTNNTGSLPE